MQKKAVFHVKGAELVNTSPLRITLHHILLLKCSIWELKCKSFQLQDEVKKKNHKNPANHCGKSIFDVLQAGGLE